MVNRRALMMSGIAFGVGGAAWMRSRPIAAAPGRFPISRTDAEWRRMLKPAQYEVLRREGTERPFTSPLLEEHRRGVFACAGCRTDAFSSDTKYDSRTGWPSFWDALPGIGTTRDESFGTVRTAVHCGGCGGHLGHVFDDGPKPTGQRYCMNGVALVFRPTA